MRWYFIRHAMSEKGIRKTMKRLDEEGRRELMKYCEVETWEEVVSMFCEHLSTHRMKPKEGVSSEQDDARTVDRCRKDRRE